MSLEPLVAAVGAAAAPLLESLALPPHATDSLPALGLRRSARLPVLAALYRQSPQPLLLVADRHDRALALLDELALWLPEAPRLFFPEPNPLFYEFAPWGPSTRRDRLSVLTMLAAYHTPGAARPAHPPVIAASVRALMTRSLPRRDFLRAIRTFKVGQSTRLDDLLHTWAGLGYEPAHTVTLPGQMARRGGILDIWPPSEPQPARLEFFGDEIDTLRSFDPASQRTVQSLERLQITPAREYLPDPALAAAFNLPYAAETLDGQNYHEFFIPLFHPVPSGLLEYLPPRSLAVLDDAQAAQAAAEELDEQAAGLRQEFVKDGRLPPDFPAPYLVWSELADGLARRRALDLGGPDLSPEPQAAPFQRLAGAFEPGPRFGGRLKPALEHLQTLLHSSRPVFIVSRQIARLQELWREGQAGETQPVFIEGSIAEGWSLKAEAGEWHLLTDGEFFGWKRPEPRQRHRQAAEAPEAAYADMLVGDWVVHVDHGIGKFIDLVRRTVDGHEREYLCIEYAAGDQLFVPVYQADRLSRYVGPEGKPPTPTRLGGQEWRNTRADVKEAVQHVAEDLLELYARRQIVQGNPFSADNPWQQELEASFPYLETEDQLRVIAEVKRDMESPRPMDRLICGDVGYGKTEVALRAAFKAVLDGRQVAILVPTTVLAQQHYHTFRERLAAFPAEVEMLSRFRNPQQQKEILQKLALGQIDIVIGTHRLIQPDVQFKNLGLLIIDEEQRFGVSHKEMLKRMRTEVDVLTMTATPIPRTLYMALAGVRDISTINTPPEERLPVITHVGPYEPRLVRQAVLRELERGGQVFFVHNRVQTINAMRTHLEKLLPEIRLTVAHGQMNEHELSQRMDLFASGDVDLLLCTSIIESGLDIPNANTLIVDRADTFGLAQLYQLRGRVGRGAQRAYAYFFRHGKLQPTADGRERLQTISENTQLGAGFSIAMRDLEIRGSGDLLGMRQSGHIAAVGFHLYTRLLADAVRRLRRLPGALAVTPMLTAALQPGAAQTEQPAPAQTPGALLPAVQELRLPVNVDLPLHLGLPLDYVPDRDVRLRLYRRIADLPSLPELDAIAAEFHDRFGPLPPAVAGLLYQAKVRLLAEKAGLAAVGVEGSALALRYPPQPEGAPPRRIPEFGADVRTGRNGLWLNLSGNWQARLLEVLEGL